MSEPHDHSHPHTHEAKKGSAPEPLSPTDHVDDAGSRALSEALRSSFVIVRWIMVALVIVFLGSGIFTVPPNQRAVVLRFGKPLTGTENQLIGPGLHWSFPPPIDEVVKIPISEIQNVSSTVGWFQMNPDGSESYMGAALNPAVDGYTITADGNIIHARVSADYRITDPIDYVLNFVNARELVTNALDNALLRASVQFNVDNAVRLERGAFQEKVVQIFNQTIQQQRLGIVVESSRLESRPPRQVNEAFNAVIAADQERSTTNSAARSAASTLVSSALSQSNSIVNSAFTESAQLLSRLSADATNFLGRLPAYERNPELFRDILLTETWSRVMANADVKWLLPDVADGKTRELRLQLNNAMESEADKERRLKQKAEQNPIAPAN